MKPDDPQLRYARIADLLDIGALGAKRATIFGLGSMGQPIAEQLVRHGVGTQPGGRMRVIDGDVVDLRNLIGTNYRRDHVGLQKVDACASLLREVNEDVSISGWKKHLEVEDLPQIVRFAERSDLLGFFADDFELLKHVAAACSGICSMVAAFFGPRCDFAEVAFSVPGITPPLTLTIGERPRHSIRAPQALGCDTAFVANFVAALCLRLLAGEGRGAELFSCYANAPLIVVGLRPTWIFENQTPDLVRSVVAVGIPVNVQ